MRNRITILVLLLLLAGCTHCQVATFYKAQSEGGTRYYIEPNIAGFTLSEVPFTIAICSDSYLAPPKDTAALCITLELDPSTSLQFSKPKVILSAGLSPPKEVAMTSITYDIYCHDEHGERICTSSEDSPIAGTVQKLSGNTQINRYTFAPTFEFRGAKDTLHEGAWFGHRLTGKRRYLVRTIPVATQPGAELTAQLPQVIINGRVFTPPTLRFHAVTEEVCRFVPLN